MPIHNIFKSKRKNKPITLPKIIIDIHEKNSLVLSSIKRSNKAIVEIKHLDIGDYSIGDIILERKTVSDLISSMINKRLIIQIKEMQQYKKSLLIIEGDLDKILNEETNISKALRGLLLSISTNSNTSIIRTQDYKDTATYLIALAKQQLKTKAKTSLHSKIPKTKEEQKQYILESFPKIGPKKAEELIKKFKTIKDTINADEEDLKEVLKSQTKSFKDLIDK